MIPLPFLWKWLWVNFSPLDDQQEGSPEKVSSSSSSASASASSSTSLQENGDDGIPKDVVVQELLSTKEVNKPDNVQAAVFAKALIGRYLCVLFKDSVHCRTRFTSATKDSSLYTVRRTSAAEREARLKEVPAFPQDLRVKILQELKEERLGRTSARNLLQLMTQSPSSVSSASLSSLPPKKPRLETSASTLSLMSPSSSSSASRSPERSSSRSPAPASPAVGSGSESSQGSQGGSMDLVVEAAAAAVPHGTGNSNRKRRREGDEVEPAGGPDTNPESGGEGQPSQGEKKPHVLAESRRSALKRSVSMSSSTLMESASDTGRPAQRMRLDPPAGGNSHNAVGATVSAEPASQRGGLTPAAGTAAQGGLTPTAAMGRLLRRQVSTPVLPTQTARAGTAAAPVPPTGGAAMHQEPWKREINDLWAKQLAMLREINTLKNELGRREAARQREILGLRQEIDGLRGEVFRLRQMKGLKPASSDNLLAGAAQKPAPEVEQTGGTPPAKAPRSPGSAAAEVSPSAGGATATASAQKEVSPTTAAEAGAPRENSTTSVGGAAAPGSEQAFLPPPSPTRPTAKTAGTA